MEEREGKGENGEKGGESEEGEGSGGNGREVGREGEKNKFT